MGVTICAHKCGMHFRFLKSSKAVIHTDHRLASFCIDWCISAPRTKDLLRSPGDAAVAKRCHFLLWLAHPF
eukprot:scaffold233230_cov17-Tisochrysis_lutea.AAC.3